MIKVVNGQQLSDFLSDKRGDTVGFVPTMGALHAGHASLVEAAKQNNDTVVVSIFVNPMQFNQTQDYQSYPRVLKNDSALLGELGVDCLFLPEQSNLYPAGYNFSVLPHNEIAAKLEGLVRPGHFAGMLTVVMKLLMLVRADRAYFGEKDYQQVVLVEEMVRSFFLSTEVVRCPTIREKEGFPLSSRNVRLRAHERGLLENGYQVLRQEKFDDLTRLSAEIELLGLKVEYLEDVDDRIFLAFHLGDTRVIDNFLKSEGPCCYG